MSHVISAANNATMINMAAIPPTFQGSATRIADKNNIRGTIPANERRALTKSVESVRNRRCRATTATINSTNSLSRSN